MQHYILASFERRYKQKEKITIDNVCATQKSFQIHHGIWKLQKSASRKKSHYPDKSKKFTSTSSRSSSMSIVIFARTRDEALLNSFSI